MRALSFGRKPRTQSCFPRAGFFFLTHLNVTLHRQVGRLIARPKENMPPKWLLTSSSYIQARTNERTKQTINEKLDLFH